MMTVKQSMKEQQNLYVNKKGGQNDRRKHQLPKRHHHTKLRKDKNKTQR